MNKTTNNAKTQLDEFLKSAKSAAYFFAAITSGGLFVYIYKFGGNGLGGTDQFGQFGDYIGGLLNPTLSFITILLLITSIRVQMLELAATREELAASKDELRKSSVALEASRSAHEENVSLQKRENIRRQLNDDFKQRLSSINQLLDKPVFPFKTVTERGQTGYAFKSFNDLYAQAVASDVSDLSLIIDFYKQQPFEEDLFFNLYSTEKKILTYLDYLCSCVVELYNYLDNDYVSESVHIQASEIFEKCGLLKILNTELTEIYSQSLQIPRKRSNR